MCKVLSLVLCILCCSSLRAQVYFSEETPLREVRAVWLTTLAGLDWPHTYSDGSFKSIELQQQELISILDKLQAAGINTVLFQVRTRGMTIYPSAELWSKYLTGTAGVSPGYDPLAFAVEQCHSRGMELHAWVVTIPIGKWKDKACVELRKKYPSLIKKIGDEGYLDPEKSGTATLLADICADLTQRYDLDGIHLDYIRYPEKWRLTISPDRARENITNIVQQIYTRVKAIKPWVKVSSSPVGRYKDLPNAPYAGWNAYSRVYQDAQGWMRMGIMDELFPMMYFSGETFVPYALDWQEHSYGRIVAPGLGIYFLSPTEKNWSLQTITQQLAALRSNGMGFAFFRSKFFTDNVKGLYSFVYGDHDRNYALVPAMTWACDSSPSAPTVLDVDSLTHTLSWSGAEDKSGANYLNYNIYSSRHYPVDVAKASNLVYPRTAKTSLTVPLDGRYYAVTAMDRYGNESDAIQQRGVALQRDTQGLKRSSILPLFECDGQKLYLGNLHLNRSELLQIETLQGKPVKTVFQADTINVSDLDEGFYAVRSIGKKKVSHRLGFFKIDRREK